MASIRKLVRVIRERTDARGGRTRQELEIASPTVAALTDNTTGTAGASLEDVTATPTQTLINNNFATLNAKLDELRDALASTGVLD